MPYGEAQKRATARWIEKIGVERYREIRRKAMRRQRETNMRRLVAYGAVALAVREGRLVKPALCERCWKEMVQGAHHWAGYEEENWLNVIWLCRGCHNEVEKERRKAERYEEGRKQILSLHPRASV